MDDPLATDADHIQFHVGPPFKDWHSRQVEIRWTRFDTIREALGLRLVRLGVRILKANWVEGDSEDVRYG